MSIDGIWDLTITTPIGAQGGTLRVVVRDHDLEGEVTGPNGPLTLLGGVVVGDELFWTIDAEAGAIAFAARLAGDTMTGEIQLDGFADITFVGTHIEPTD